MKQTTKENPNKPKAGSTKLQTTKHIDIKWWIASIIFAVLTVVFFWEHLSGNAFFWDDFAEYVYPVQSLAAKSFSHGDIPFWNPNSFVGMPFLADIQVGFFYPLNRLLTLFVGADDVLSVPMLQFTLILHFFIAQISMFFAARHFKVSSIGSIISAVSFAFSFLFVCHVFHPMIISHLAWFPLILMLMHKGISEANIKCGIWAGLIFGMTMLSGHPQMTLFTGLFLGFFLLWFLVADLKKGTFKELSILKYITAGVVPFIIALGIFQIQFMPSKELADLSKRNEMTYEKAAEGSLEIEQVFSMIVPKIFGYSNGENTQTVPYYLQANLPDGTFGAPPAYYYWETSFYFGLAAFILGLFAMLTMFKNRMVAFLIAFSIFAFVFALGANGFLLGIFHSLPFFSQLRMPARMMFGLIFAFSLLAGLGFDRLSESTEKSDLYKLLGAAAFPIFAALLTAGGILPGMLGAAEKFIPELQSFGTTALIFALLVLGVSFLTLKKMIPTVVAGGIIAILAFIDLYIAGSDFNISPTSISKQYELPAETIKAFTPTYPNDIFRVNMRMYSPSYMAMKRNQGMVTGIELVEGYNPLILQRVVPPLNTKGEIHSLFNVKYEIAIDSVRGIPYFSEKQDRLPRAYFVNSAVIKNESSVEQFMRNNKVDYSKTVVLEENLPFSLPISDSISRGDVKITEYYANRFKIQVDAAANGVLCLSEIYYPAWKAYVDGKEAKIYRSNYCFRALALAQGKHNIEFVYESSAFSAGSWIAFITLICSILGLVFIDKKQAVNK